MWNRSLLDMSSEHSYITVQVIAGSSVILLVSTRERNDERFIHLAHYYSSDTELLNVSILKKQRPGCFIMLDIIVELSGLSFLSLFSYNSQNKYFRALALN